MGIPIPSACSRFKVSPRVILAFLINLLIVFLSQQVYPFEKLNSQAVFEPTSGVPPVSSNEIDQYPMRVIFDSHCFALTGGPEAMIQALVSCRSVGLDCYRYEGYCHRAFYREYPGLWRVPTVKKNSIRAGDLLIVPEIQAPFGYGASQRFKSAKVAVFLLQALRGVPKEATREYKSGRNVRLIPHTHGLVDYPAGKPHGNPAFLMEPYIRPSLVRHAKSILVNEKAVIDLKFQAKLILVDNDSPEDKIEAIKQAAQMTGFKVLVPRRLSRAALEEQQKRATFVIDWCFVGAERMPIETSLYGAALITSDCKQATTWEDIPIPERFRLNPSIAPNELIEAFKSIFELGRSKEQIGTLFHQFEPVRNRFLEEITPDHLAGQVKSAIKAMWTQEKRNLSVVDTSLQPKMSYLVERASETCC